MGWFWGSSDGSASADPAKQLDPSLKQFLEKESASTPAAQQHQQQHQQLAQPPSPPAAAATTTTTTPQQHDNSPASAPAESLYPDGRYAHLWKTYEPLSSIESRTRSDQEKLSDIVAAYNDRRANIGRAALENCAFEQAALSDCFRSGSWAARVSMCRADTQALDRCYTMQSRFLKALGYLAVQGEGREREEAVQMHADRLYQRMVAQERAVREARERGEEPPVFGSILSRENVAAAMKGEVAPVVVVGVEGVARAKVDEAKAREREERELAESLDEMRGLSPKMRKEFEARLQELHGEERDVELRVIQGEYAESKIIAKQVEALFEEERVRRLQRQEHGKATIGDTIKKWWGW
ncbi:autophagy protein [Diplodia corticola]|uniref:Autophagy protein n=1 Tax=Diplodia corticola TaxID=236234 RepID=A0A1J9QM21_9PEZI|nr:autophagy protein [Diplodia corticola]OJD29513.1 autophagy protein [Diplodia corticola]